MSAGDVQILQGWQIGASVSAIVVSRLAQEVEAATATLGEGPAFEDAHRRWCQACLLDVSADERLLGALADGHVRQVVARAEAHTIATSMAEEQLYHRRVAQRWAVIEAAQVLNEKLAELDSRQPSGTEGRR